MDSFVAVKQLKLKKGKERSIQRKHHWVFSGAIATRDSSLKEGDLVQVLDSKENILAIGHFGEKSIAVRILSFEVELKESFWRDKIKLAAEHRESLQLKDTNVYRLLHGEGDGLPGLIIDVYSNVFVVQTHSHGMSLALPKIEAALKEEFGAEIEIVHKTAIKQSSKSNSKIVEVLENGMKLKVDVGAGQKTGFFVDQRESRAELANLSESKKVLNVFSYTGGFSVAALKAGAKKVDSVDLSKSAIKLCSENMALNAGKETIEHSEIVEDAFEFLSNKPLDYDIIVLDPPAFAKQLSAKKNALRAYQRLNQICFQKVKPGTLVFTFSCSQVVSKQDFHYAILNAGWNTNRGIKILKEFGQAKDHPVNLFHPETDYLKGLLLYIE